MCLFAYYGCRSWDLRWEESEPILHDMIVNATGSLSSFISRVVESFADSADCASLELDENVII